MCQESSAITVDQVAGAGEIFTVAAGACSVYVLCQNTQEVVNKRWADFLRNELQNQLGATMMYEGEVVDIASLADEQILAITGKDKMLQYYPMAKNVFFVVYSAATVYFAVKGIQNLISNNGGYYE